MTYTFLPLAFTKASAMPSTRRLGIIEVCKFPGPKTITSALSIASRAFGFALGYGSK